mgnify:CR=1 FL=1
MIGKRKRFENPLEQYYRILRKRWPTLVLVFSVTVALTSTVIASVLALPFGLFVGLGRFRGRRVVVGLLNTLMALPTVLVGLVVYAFITRRGPLGSLELLYTQTAMVIGQVILAFS